jgi:hypothetical protein
MRKNIKAFGAFTHFIFRNTKIPEIEASFHRNLADLCLHYSRYCNRALVLVDFNPDRWIWFCMVWSLLF